MPSRRKQTVGTCQFAQGHCWSTPCGGAGNLTEGSSLYRIQPIFCLEARCLLLTVHSQPKINPPSWWFSLLCLSQCEACVDWAAPSEHCNWGFITKRWDKKHQPSVSAMMSIFDGISLAFLCHCLKLLITSCTQWCIEMSEMTHSCLKLRFHIYYWNKSICNDIRSLSWVNKCFDCSNLSNPNTYWLWNEVSWPGDLWRFPSTGIWKKCF